MISFVSIIHEFEAVRGSFGVEVRFVLDLSINCSERAAAKSPLCPSVVNLGLVANSAHEVSSTAARKQDYVENCHFEQRSFDSASEISMLNPVNASAADIGNRVSLMLGRVFVFVPALNLLV